MLEQQAFWTRMDDPRDPSPAEKEFGMPADELQLTASVPVPRLSVPDVAEPRVRTSSAARRLVVRVALPLLCAGLVAGTLVLAPAMERVPILWATLIAAAAGFSASSIGVYGGVLVPGLLLMGVDPRFAAAASLFLQVLVIPLGAGAHARLGNVSRHIVVPLILGGVIGSFTGPYLGALLEKEVATRVVAGLIVLVGVVVLMTLRWGGLGNTKPVHEVSQARVGGVGLVAGFASGVSGAGWGPIGVKLLFLLRIEPRQAIGSSLMGRVFMAVGGVVGYLMSASAFQNITPDLWLLVPMLAGSLATMIPGVHLVSHMRRDRAVVFITLLSIALALPVLIRGQ